MVLTGARQAGSTGLTAGGQATHIDELARTLYACASSLYWQYSKLAAW